MPSLRSLSGLAAAALAAVTIGSGRAAAQTDALYRLGPDSEPQSGVPQGTVTEWEVEMMSLNHLKSYGWSRSTVKEGDVISCTGGAAKSGAPAMLSSLIKLGDGRMIKS